MSIFDNVMMVGDFNGMVDNSIDRSSLQGKKKLSKWKLPKSFLKLVGNEGLIDVWRERNQGNKDFSFYSDRHKIWTTKNIGLLTGKTEILPRNLSDYNPILWQARKKTETSKT